MEVALMRTIRITSTAILSLLLGIAAPAYAQEEQHGEKQDHPQQQQGKHEQAKPEQQHGQQQRESDQKQQQTQRQDQNNQQQRAQQQQRQDQNSQQQRAQQQRGDGRPQRTRERDGFEQSGWQEHRAQSWQSDHRTWEQRGGYRGYRIPDDRFRGYFGPDHG